MVGRDSIIIIKVFIVCTSVLFKRRVLDHIRAIYARIYIYVYPHPCMHRSRMLVCEPYTAYFVVR